MLKLISSSSDQAVAQRILEDFQAAGYAISSEAPVHGDVAILMLSSAALADAALQAALVKALDLSLHIVPVMTQRVKLPKLIDHLDVVDFSDGYDFDVLRKQVDFELSAGAPRPIRVLTPTVKRSNRTVGIVLGLIAFGMFAAGLYGVGVLHIQAPIQEFNDEATMEAATVMILVEPVMATYQLYFPLTTAEAAAYPATLQAIPTVYRPLVAATATALVTTPTPKPDNGSDFGF